MSQDIVSELAPTGTLRAGINLANILLVTGATSSGEPTGVAPDMACAIVDRLGVAVSYVTFASPGEVADAISTNAWDIALIAAEPARAETIAFSSAYLEIEATYLVPAGSPMQSIADIDRPGVRIVVSDRSAYDLYLTRTLKHAELHRAQGLAGAFALFVDQGLDALAGLRPALKDNAKTLPGAQVLAGCYTTVQQAIGTKPENASAAAFLQEFVAEAKTSGLIARLLERHGVAGKLQVAADD
jgi:polar amino acid transport system substrate-binding protein